MSESESPIIQVGSSEFDMTRAPDRGLVHRAFVGYPESNKYEKRWEGVDRQTKADILKATKVAMRMAIEKGDHRGIVGCANFIRGIECDNQADEHLEFRANNLTGASTQVNIQNNVGQAQPDNRALIAELMRDPDKADELARLADRVIDARKP